jgi:hypothetical protein
VKRKLLLYLSNSSNYGHSRLKSCSHCVMRTDLNETSVSARPFLGGEFSQPVEAGESVKHCLAKKIYVSLRKPLVNKYNARKTLLRSCRLQLLSCKPCSSRFMRIGKFMARLKDKSEMPSKALRSRTNNMHLALNWVKGSGGCTLANCSPAYFSDRAVPLIGAWTWCGIENEGSLFSSGRFECDFDTHLRSCAPSSCL